MDADVDEPSANSRRQKPVEVLAMFEVAMEDAEAARRSQIFLWRFWTAFLSRYARPTYFICWFLSLLRG
jgi:hypothetical protein